MVPLPPPLGLAFIGKVYLVLAATCSLSMGTAVTLVDGLDGLAGGIAALALIGLSVAALPICSGKMFYIPSACALSFSCLILLWSSKNERVKVFLFCETGMI